MAMVLSYSGSPRAPSMPLGVTMSQIELLISQNCISSRGLHLREGTDQEPQSHPQPHS